MSSIYILGISCFYHDSSVTLVKDGVVVCAIEEERLSRRKHDNSFPENAINYCLSYEKITMADLTTVAFYEVPSLKFHRYMTQHLLHSPWSYGSFRASFPSWIKEKLNFENILKERYDYTGKITYVQHHLAHLASSFYPSGFESTAFVTLDGVGEWETSTFGVVHQNKITQMGSISYPHSLGLFYSALTSFLGFSVNDSEYKVMGLAAYGNQNKETNIFYKRLCKIITVKDDGSYNLDIKYFDFLSASKMYTKRLSHLLEIAPRNPTQEMKREYKDIASAVQMVTEDIALKIFNHVHKVTNEDNLVFAGGIALNSVLNGKILSKSPFKKMYIQPAAGDDGCSLGAALYAFHQIVPDQKPYKIDNIYLGPSFSDNFIEKFLNDHEISCKKYDSEETMIQSVAKLIFENNIVGWFQGRMEWGPRALGARSILGNPCNPNMQDILNQKVKHREEFRPFAPAVCLEDAQKYFLCDVPIQEPAKFMLMVYPVREEYRSLLPAITHVDGSGRLQVVEWKTNPLYYNLIKSFGQISGIPMLINTSFNIKGEPIVCTPKDAYYCMMGTEIDFLVMGRYIIRRSDNINDIWVNKRDYLFFN